MHGRREEREAEDGGSRGSTGAKRKERYEANKMMGAVGVRGEEELRERWQWWWWTSRERKKWQRKGCRKERSRSGQRLEIERNGRRPGRGWRWWVYGVGKGREGGMVGKQRRTSSRRYRCCWLWQNRVAWGPASNWSYDRLERQSLEMSDVGGPDGGGRRMRGLTRRFAKDYRHSVRRRAGLGWRGLASHGCDEIKQEGCECRAGRRT